MLTFIAILLALVFWPITLALAAAYLLFWGCVAVYAWWRMTDFSGPWITNSIELGFLIDPVFWYMVLILTPVYWVIWKTVKLLRTD